eukprot:5402411-Pyramimonas_sp.AAC.1
MPAAPTTAGLSPPRGHATRPPTPSPSAPAAGPCRGLRAQTKEEIEDSAPAKTAPPENRAS